MSYSYLISLFKRHLNCQLYIGFNWKSSSGYTINMGNSGDIGLGETGLNHWDEDILREIESETIIISCIASEDNIILST